VKLIEGSQIGYLNSGFGESRFLGQFLASVDVGVLGTFEGSFQLFQLLRAERRSGAALLPLQGDARLRFDVRVIIT